jgi:RNA 3'-terminal phosphate cyclase (ATP)
LCVYSHISEEIIQKEVDDAKIILTKNGFDCEISIKEENALDKGCSILIFSNDTNSVIGSDGIYQKSLNGLGESVAKKFIESNLGVDLCLSDMLVVPLSLIKETSVYRVKQITKHLETNLFVASKITGCKYGIGKIDDGFEVRISGISDA